MKKRVERWLARGLLLRRAQLPIPGPAILDLPMGEHLTNAVAALGCYERATLVPILELCRGASCFVDVGAQFGQFTLAVSAVLAPHGKVVAIEPNPQNYLELCRNLSLNKRTNVYPVLAAVAEHDSFLRLVPENRGNTGATSTELELRGGQMTVPALPLAEILRRLNIASVDVMKLDVEGFEPQALRGLFGSDRLKPKCIFFEYLPATFTSGDETVSLLRQNGYSVRQVSGEPFHDSQKPLDDNLWASLDGYAS